MFAGQMIGHKLITKQTGARGRICNSVYICERKFARREFYLAILMDRATQAPVIVASSQGGMDIETVAKETPDAIITTNIDLNTGVTDEIARNIATELGFSEQCIEDAKDTIQRLYRVFMERDATQIEINPLSETNDHQVLAMDAKLGFDDNAEFRQKEVFSWRDTSQEDADEVKAAEYVLPPWSKNLYLPPFQVRAQLYQTRRRYRVSRQWRRSRHGDHGYHQTERWCPCQLFGCWWRRHSRSYQVGV